MLDALLCGPIRLAALPRKSAIALQPSGDSGRGGGSSVRDPSADREDARRTTVAVEPGALPQHFAVGDRGETGRVTDAGAAHCARVGCAGEVLVSRNSGRRVTRNRRPMQIASTQATRIILSRVIRVDANHARERGHEIGAIS